MAGELTGTEAWLGDRLHLDLPAEAHVLVGIRRTLRRWLAQRELPDATTYEITLACVEACTNAIEHARQPRRAGFEVAGRMSDYEIAIEVRDHGQWREARDDYDRGRGITLMEALMDDVRVQPGPEGTTVRMRRRIHVSSAA